MAQAPTPKPANHAHNADKEAKGDLPPPDIVKPPGGELPANPVVESPKWEVVTEDVNLERTSRLKVDGGYLYKTAVMNPNGSGDYMVSIAFAPD